MVVDKLIETIKDDETEPSRAGFSIQEEWSFIDEESSTVRQIDALVAWQPDRNYQTEDKFSDPSNWINVELAFLIECKQSELPYVALTRETAGSCRIPILLGLPCDNIQLIPRENPDLSIGMSAYDALAIWDLGFPSPALAVSIAKAHRKGGKDLELSGEETYRSVTLPMLKALDYYKKTSTPREGQIYHTVRLVFPIVVVRAPLVGVRVQGGEVELRDLQWTRLLRSEPESGQRWDSNTSGIDIVQYEYLPSYAQAAKAAVIDAAARIKSFSAQLLTGKAMFGDEGGALHPNHPYTSLPPHLDAQGVEDFLRNRFREAHR
jgi:hypothetical protein